MIYKTNPQKTNPMDEEREISDGQYFEIDYTATAFTAKFCMQGKLCPASFMREATSDGSEPIFTDRFMVSLLHPEIGTVVFYLILLMIPGNTMGIFP